MKIPTRISLDPADPGFIKSKVKRRKFKVHLDGKPLRGVITADSEKGTVYKTKQDPVTGSYVQDGEYWAREELTGVVEILLKQPF